MPTVNGKGAKIHYEQVGTGPDIVWVSGGGGTAADWDQYQLPFFKSDFRNTTFDNRGVGTTVAADDAPWPMEGFARDVIDLIEAVCEPPVSLVGLSFGSAIVQEVAIMRPDLLRCAIVMGTGAYSVEWGWDYQAAEIEFRRAGGRLDGMMAVTHYAAFQYPARVLGDRELWPKLRAELMAYMAQDDHEDSLIPQWDVSLRFDQRDRLPGCLVPMHVIAFTEDVQAPPQDGQELAEMAGAGEFHLFEGMGHCSIFGHTHDILNPFIKSLVGRHL
jgi:3-oxoadipate enol-lactonase